MYIFVSRVITLYKNKNNFPAGLKSYTFPFPNGKGEGVNKL
jgi:hypothetical protein